VRNSNVTNSNDIWTAEVHEIFMVAKTMEQKLTSYREKCAEQVGITDKER
jgi:hypothetical protein